MSTSGVSSRCWRAAPARQARQAGPLGGDGGAQDATASDSGEETDSSTPADSGSPVHSGTGVDSATGTTDAANDSAAASDSSGLDAAADVDAGCLVSALYVAPGTGLDSSSGTQALSPLKMLTHAIALAGANPCITTIHAAPGTYDSAGGETFPLAPSNVAIVGDETNKGNAASGAVLISGSGLLMPGQWVAVAPGPNVTLAGLKIAAPSVTTDGSAQVTYDVWLAASGAVVRNSTIAGNEIGIQIETGAVAVLTGNALTAHTQRVLRRGLAGRQRQRERLGQRRDRQPRRSAGDGGGDDRLRRRHAGQHRWKRAVVQLARGRDRRRHERRAAARFLRDYTPPTTGSTSVAGLDIKLAGGSAITTGYALAPNPCP